MAWTVAIRGGGVAAACCERLLRQGGAATSRTGEPHPPVPAIMLSEAALALLRDTLGRPDLYAANPRIMRRIVAWGGQRPIPLPHAAVVLGAGDLDFAPDAGHSAPPAPDFTIRTAPPDADEPFTRFGERFGETAPAWLLVPEDADACWVEAVPDGWLFLIPASPSRGWLLAIGAPCAVLLDQSRHIASRITLDAQGARRFDTSPRMLRGMAGADWLACGSAAMAFDPICGDGTALAARQAILASAIALALRDGDDPDALLGHYRTMTIAAMRRHLRHCFQFYSSGGEGPWWRKQQAALAEGFAACSARLEREAPPRYALRGFRLVHRELAA